ncbi:uncharacterized protein LOC143857682 [Tasmannia lanceolata]|uniref:uncharacterized protein LOC143857682 n=1 Tax=Tasmannia lanceolata TaxID=3420 RepID=UPI00406373DD
MSIFKTLIGFCLITSFFMVSAITQDSKNLTAYEMLESYNFPKGILPQGVKGYVLNQDGSFEAYLDGECNFAVEGGYSLSYRKTISGKVSVGSLKELRGVSVKVLFIWLGISEVSSVDGQLDLYVGPVSASFPLSNFEECPRCGCGLDCVNMVFDS